MIGVLNSWLATSMKALFRTPDSASSWLARVSRSLASWSWTTSRFRSATSSYCSTGLADQGLEFQGVPGLEDVAEDPPLVDRVDDRLDVGVPGEEHPHRVGPGDAGLGQEGVAAHPRHPLVREDHVDVLATQDLQGRVAGPGREDAIGAVEQVPEALEDVGLVVHDQEGMSPPLHHRLPRPPIAPGSQGRRGASGPDPRPSTPLVGPGRPGTPPGPPPPGPGPAGQPLQVRPQPARLQEGPLLLIRLGQLAVDAGEPELRLPQLGDQPPPVRDQVVMLDGLADDPLQLQGVPGA